MKIPKIILTVVIAVAVCFAAFVLFMLAITHDFEKVSHDIELYEQVAAEEASIPSLEELGTYKELDFKYFRKKSVLFKSEAYVMKVAYDSAEYAAAKENMLGDYSYQSEVPAQGDEEYDNDTIFTLDTFDFGLLRVDEVNYPQKLIFVGASDETYEIAYVCFRDQDLDYIDKSYADFIREECGWE